MGIGCKWANRGSGGLLATRSPWDKREAKSLASAALDAFRATAMLPRTQAAALKDISLATAALGAAPLPPTNKELISGH